MFSLRIVWIICGVLLAGIVLIWFGAGGFGAKRSESLAIPADADSSKGPPTVWSSLRRAEVVRPAKVSQPVSFDVPSSTNDATNLQAQTEESMASQLEDEEKARTLLELFPILPPEDQVEAATDLSLTLSDEDYPALGAYLTDASLPEPVLDALLEGLLLREDVVKAPLLLVVAQQQQHPLAAEARALLEDLLGGELEAENPAAWTAVVQSWLQANLRTGP